MATETLFFALLREALLHARSSGRDETDIDRLGLSRFGGLGKPRCPVEGSLGEIALVDRFDAPRWAFRAER